MKGLEAMINEVLEPALKLAGAQIRDLIRGYEHKEDGLKDELALANREIERLSDRNKTLEGQVRGVMPKRRGRPPKKNTAEAPVVPPLKKKRGRPPKLAVSPQGTLKGQPKRGPGRPRKIRPEDMQVAATATGEQPVKRPRGRPRKVVPALPPLDAAHARGRSPEEQGQVEQAETAQPQQE